jgi:cardiolipin synthase
MTHGDDPRRIEKTITGCAAPHGRPVSRSGTPCGHDEQPGHDAGGRGAAAPGEQRPDLRAPLEALLGVPFTDGNEVRILRNGSEAFPAILDAIRAATRSIDMLWFGWNAGSITQETAAALADRARHGVRVRVLLDGFGALHVDRAQIREMHAAGATVLFHRPLRTWRVTTINHRSHERVLVCDEEVGVTGGTGIDRHWTGDAQDPEHYRDTAVLVRGPAVAGLRAAFARDWLQTTRPLLTDVDRFPPLGRPGSVAVQVLRAPSQHGWNNAAVAVLGLLRLARRRVRIATPYVRLSARFHDLLAATVAGGVQVQLLVTGPHPDRPFVELQSQRQWQRLLDAGVELWCYQPTLMHAKVITVDERLAMLGTTNLDVRSLTLNEQIGLVVDDPALTTVLDGHFDDDLARSHRLLDAEWRRRGVRQRLLEVGADLAGAPLRGVGGAGLTARRP